MAQNSGFQSGTNRFYSIISRPGTLEQLANGPITVSPAAGADDDIVKIITTGIRCNDVNFHLFIYVIGKTSDGVIKYFECDTRMINKSILVDMKHTLETKYENYDTNDYYIIVKHENKKYIIGEMQQIFRIYPNVYNIRLNIPFKFNLNTQNFEINYNIKEMPEINYKIENNINNMEEIKSKSLQGDDGAIMTLKDQDRWN